MEGLWSMGYDQYLIINVKSPGPTMFEKENALKVHPR